MIANVFYCSKTDTISYYVYFEISHILINNMIVVAVILLAPNFI